MHRILCSVVCLITIVLGDAEPGTGELKKEIEHLKQTLRFLSSRFVNLEQVVSLQNKQQQIQSTKLVKLENQNEELKTRLNNEELKFRIVNEELKTRPINESLATLTQSDHFRENSAQDGHRLPRLLGDDFLNVAFYAYKSKSFSGMSLHRTMTYDTVITNVGGGYNPNTGIFTTPSAGVYAFAWVIITSGRDPIDGQYGEVCIELMQNGVSRGSIHADTEVNSDDDSSTGFAILNLQPSEPVFLRTSCGSQGTFISTERQERWSFSGFRIA